MRCNGLRQTVTVLLGGCALSAGAFEFQHGPLALEFDAANGALLRVACGGKEIARGDPRIPPVTFGVGPADHVVYFEQMGFPRKLVKPDGRRARQSARLLSLPRRLAPAQPRLRRDAAGPQGTGAR